MKKSEKEMEISQILDEIKSSTKNDVNTQECMSVSVEGNVENKKAEQSEDNCEKKLPDKKTQNKRSTNKKSKKSITVKLDFSNSSVTELSISDFTISKSEIPSTVKVELLINTSKSSSKIVLTNLRIWKLVLYLRKKTSPTKLKYNNDNIHLYSSFTNKNNSCSFCSEDGQIILDVTDLNGNETKIYFCKKCFQNFKNAIIKINGYLNSELILNKYDKINLKHQNLVAQFNSLLLKNRNYKDQLNKLEELKDASNENINEYLLQENSELYLRIEELQRNLAVYNNIFQKLDKFKSEFDKMSEIGSIFRKILKDVIK